MTATARASLDHVGIVAADFAATCARYERLGFRLTTAQRQSGPVRPGGQPEPWGTANRCAMLRQGYLEILGIVEPGHYDNQLGGFLARDEGIHILALEVEDAERELGRLAAAGFPELKIHPLIRGAATPEGERQVGFLRIPLPVAHLHGGRVQLLEHQSAGILWQPALTEHPNRVTALAEVVLRVNDLGAACDFYRRALGAESAPEAGGEVSRLRLAAGDLVLATPEGCRRLFPEDPLPASIDFVACGLRTDDGARAFRRILEDAAIPFRARDGRLAVPAEQAGGALLWVE